MGNNMKFFKPLFFILVILNISSSFASEWKLSWVANDLPNPESVVFDKKRNILFVSNQNYTQTEGGGSIGQLSLTGGVLKKEWVKGLNKPKGILIVNDRLFVSDVTELVEIGSGRVLSGLAKKSPYSFKISNIDSLESLKNYISSI